MQTFECIWKKTPSSKQPAAQKQISNRKWLLLLLNNLLPSPLWTLQSWTGRRRAAHEVMLETLTPTAKKKMRLLQTLFSALFFLFT